MRTGGYSEKEIVSILKEHPYRINLAMKSTYNIENIKNILLKLSNLDYEIVTGKTDKYFGFEMFLLDAEAYTGLDPTEDEVKDFLKDIWTDFHGAGYEDETVDNPCDGTLTKEEENYFEPGL